MTKTDFERAHAWEMFRAGLGPKPAPRPKRPSELAKAALRGKTKSAASAPVTAVKQPKRVKEPVARVTGGEPVAEPEVPHDPVALFREKKGFDRLKNEHGKLVELLHEERERNAFLGQLKAAHQTPQIMRTEKTSGIREMTAIIQGSDWHVEETVEAIKTNYRNEYNLDIADRRITRFFNGAIDLIEHHRADKKTVVRDAVLSLTGDLVTGTIHEELLENNALSPIETCLWLMPRLRNGIATLRDKLQLRKIVVCCSHGNHGRTTPRTRISTGAENNYEYLMYRMLEREFANDKQVVFEVTPAFQQYVDIYDFTLGQTHGDSVSYGGGVGGISIPLLKRLPRWDEVRYAHWWLLGHFHTDRDLGRILVNGSLIGWAPYAQWIGAAFEEPRQRFFLIDSKRGKCHTTSIWVDDMKNK